MSSRSRQPTSDRLQLTILWHDTVLTVREIAHRQSFWVGDGTLESCPCDFVIPKELLGNEALQLVDGECPLTLAIPVGAVARLCRDGARTEFRRDESSVGRRLALLPGDQCEVRFGPLVFVVEVHEGESKFAAAVRTGRSWKHSLYFVGSAAAHAAVFAIAMLFGPVPGTSGHEPVSRDQLLIMQQYLNASAEREQEARDDAEQSDDEADSKEGGTGLRARGSEGSMGERTGRGAAHRFGIAGRAGRPDAHVARDAALREAESFGMIGLLNTGAGGSPMAPSGDPAGLAPGGATGQSWGSGQGTVGLGSIGHGMGFGSGSGAASRRLPGVQRVSEPAPGREVPIDPNGRFATTYRPGRGHLAAFESAVARGILPVAARELVSEIGAGHAPLLAAPKDRALAYEIRTERASLPPSGGATHVRLALRSSPQLPSGRPTMSVHLVLDVSGSMEGESMERARQAAHRLVDKLAPTDDFSLVTFSSSAEVRVSDVRVGPHRRTIQQAIDQVRADGGTNLEAGLRLAYEQAAKRTIPADAVRVVLLLSDGRANIGVTHRPSLAAISLDAFQSGVQTSTFGLGLDYDGELMSAIAADGAGAYYYLRDGEQIGGALATEVDKRLDPAATAVEVRIRLRDDVNLLQVYGSRKLDQEESARVRAAELAADEQAEKRLAIKRDRHDDRQGGMRFFIPAFARDDAYALLIKVAAPAGVGQRDAGVVELRYKDRVSSRNVVEEIPIRLAYANSDAESARSLDPSVARTVQGFLAGEALLTAAGRVDVGDRVGAAALLVEREEILRQAAANLQEPEFLADASRLARLRAHVQGQGTVHEPRALAMLLETAARSRLQ